MTDDEFYRWAVEQAVASFGSAGCENDWNMQERTRLIIAEASGVRRQCEPPFLKEVSK